MEVLDRLNNIKWSSPTDKVRVRVLVNCWDGVITERLLRGWKRRACMCESRKNSSVGTKARAYGSILRKHLSAAMALRIAVRRDRSSVQRLRDSAPCRAARWLFEARDTSAGKAGGKDIVCCKILLEHEGVCEGFNARLTFSRG